MEKGKSMGFKDLVAWQKGMRLVEAIYKITREFPHEELYGLTSQMRRSAVSIPSNIAEGQLRKSKNEFAQFISIALGSCAELSTQFDLSKRLGYLDEMNFLRIAEDINELMKILHGLRKKLSTNTITTN